MALRLQTKYVTASDNPPVTPYGSDHVKKKYAVFSKGGKTRGHNKDTKHAQRKKEKREDKAGPVKQLRKKRVKKAANRVYTEE